MNKPTTAPRPPLLTWPQLAGLLLLTITLPLVYYGGARLDEKGHARVALELAQLKELDTLVDKELISSRFQMTASYDPLEGVIATMERKSAAFGAAGRKRRRAFHPGVAKGDRRRRPKAGRR